MSGERYIIQGQTLTNLAEAIREKTGSETDYTPIEMATAIRNLPTGGSILGTKNITLNGNYTASADGLDGYSSVSVNVPNSYGQADEGKVVSNGTLVAQGSDITTENGTVDTTLINSLTVNVSGGGTLTEIYRAQKEHTSGTGYLWNYSGTIQQSGMLVVFTHSFAGANTFKINGVSQPYNITNSNYVYSLFNTFAVSVGDTIEAKCAWDGKSNGAIYIGILT